MCKTLKFYFIYPYLLKWINNNDFQFIFQDHLYVYLEHGSKLVLILLYAHYIFVSST